MTIDRLLDWEKNNPGAENKAARVRSTWLREHALARYGYTCVGCGEDFKVFLTLDHTYGGGNAHRKRIGCTGRFYRWLYQQNYPEGYRVLCFKCNDAVHHFRQDLVEFAEAKRLWALNGELPPITKTGEVGCDARKIRKLRMIVLNAYGGACVGCGEDFPFCLAIDHMAADGATHRRQIGRSGGTLYRWLRSSNYPDGFRVLCHNCNYGVTRYNDLNELVAAVNKHRSDGLMAVLANGVYRHRLLTGEKIGSLRVGPRTKLDRRTAYECLCDCGVSKTVRADLLLDLVVSHCGCKTRLNSSKAQRLVGRGVKYTCGDRTMGLTEWSVLLGVGVGTLRSRIRRGLPYNEVFSSNIRGV